jgi:hypothetical protein
MFAALLQITFLSGSFSLNNSSPTPIQGQFNVFCLVLKKGAENISPACKADFMIAAGI